MTVQVDQKCFEIASAFLLLLLLFACSPAPKEPTFQAEGFPEHLSDWNVLRIESGVLHLNDNVTPYDLATPLFSDYALKLRTITLPKDRRAIYDPDVTFALPVGTIISKTFYFPLAGAERSVVTYGEDRTVKDGALPLGGLRLIETRILARRSEGWVALAYVWNDEQTEATLKRTGEIVPLVLKRPDGRTEPMSYLVPNANQCAGCHATNATTRAIQPIGIKARHLNKPSSFAPGINQLDHWAMLRLIDPPAAGTPKPANASWTDETASLDARARAYLDANCSHCHSDTGPADTSGLDLRPDVPMGPKFGLCKSPIAAGGGTGGRLLDIVPGKPDESIFVYRMESTNPGDMMPELGRSVTHEEGVALIQAWIAGMSGSCS
jgi:uncharacterized repeat protein (TIGR03806 family)